MPDAPPKPPLNCEGIADATLKENGYIEAEKIPPRTETPSLLRGMTPTSREAFSIVDLTTRRVNNHFVEVRSAGRYQLILQTAMLATVFAMLKYFLTHYTSFAGSISISDIGLVFTGVFFTIGIIFSQVMMDLKEAEKMSAEMASTLEQLEDGFRLITYQNKAAKRRMHHAYHLLIRLAQAWRLSLHDDTFDRINDVFATLQEIQRYAISIDKKAGSGVGAILGACDRYRRMAQRSSYLSRTLIAPPVQGLLHFFVFASTVILFFVKYTNDVTQILLMVSVYSVTWFVVRVVSAFDDPFEDEVLLGMAPMLGKQRIVHLFPLDEYCWRVLRRCEMTDVLLWDASRVGSLTEEAQRMVGDQNLTGLAFLLFEGRAVAEQRAGRSPEENEPNDAAVFAATMGSSSPLVAARTAAAFVADDSLGDDGSSESAVEEFIPSCTEEVDMDTMPTQQAYVNVLVAQGM